MLRKSSTLTDLPHSHVLKIRLTGCSNLYPADVKIPGLSKGKSDPYVKFTIDDWTKKSSIIADDLNPVWTPAEEFHMSLDVDTIRKEHLFVIVKDYDHLSSNDVIGTLNIPIKQFLNHSPDENQHSNDVEHEGARMPTAYSLKVPVNYNHKLDSKIFLDISIVTKEEYQRSKLLEIWENEVWKLGKGWTYGTDPRRWSTIENTCSSDNFQEIAPKVPENWESEGWHYTIQNGNSAGWTYAPGFNGPWRSSKTPLSFVRRRKWENACSKSA